MDSDTNNTTENIGNENQHDWIFAILSIPNIGGLLTTIITFAPAAIFSLIFILVSPADESSLPGGLLIFITAILLISMLLITWWWLNYLEAKINLAILLPIPFINIRLRWILYPFMLPFFGIHRIYQHFHAKRPVDHIDLSQSKIN